MNGGKASRWTCSGTANARASPVKWGSGRRAKRVRGTTVRLLTDAGARDSYIFGPPWRIGTMGFLWTLIIGLVVGAIAKLIMPGRDPGGIIVTMLIGVAGAMLAGFLGRAMGWYSDPGTGPGIIASIIGALILLFLYRLFTGRRGRTTTV